MMHLPYSPNPERVIEREVFEAALRNLNSDDYERIRRMAKRLSRGIMDMGDIGALELLACLGRFLVENDAL